ncbi:hypothetical protein TPB0596_38340 [Tsukamurella pulmonis]|nr:hypothetical protein TPB0596_38340 [Tsukamurella pulmonis]
MPVAEVVHPVLIRAQRTVALAGQGEQGQAAGREARGEDPGDDPQCGVHDSSFLVTFARSGSSL